MPIDDWCSEKNNSNYLDPICALLLRRKNDRWDTVKDLKSLNEVKWQENFQNYEKKFLKVQWEKKKYDKFWCN